MTTERAKTPSTARPSATLLLLRDMNGQLEVLMAQKSASINFGGSWVFPGGMVEEADCKGDAVDSITAGRRAALRETKEETAIQCQEHDMHVISRWVTPIGPPKRYSTWFFICDANDIEQTVTIDNEEIVDSKWLTPARAIELQANQQMKLNAASFVTLNELSELESAKAAVAHYQNKETREYLPRAIKIDTGYMTLYQEDYGYALSDEQVANTVGKRHRTVMHKDAAWEYINES